jgi:hypothetical protein
MCTRYIKYIRGPRASARVARRSPRIDPRCAYGFPFFEKVDASRGVGKRVAAATAVVGSLRGSLAKAQR